MCSYSTVDAVWKTNCGQVLIIFHLLLLIILTNLICIYFPFNSFWNASCFADFLYTRLLHSTVWAFIIFTSVIKWRSSLLFLSISSHLEYEMNSLYATKNFKHTRFSPLCLLWLEDAPKDELESGDEEEDEEDEVSVKWSSNIQAGYIRDALILFF